MKLNVDNFERSGPPNPEETCVLDRGLSNVATHEKVAISFLKCMKQWKRWKSDNPRKGSIYTPRSRPLPRLVVALRSTLHLPSHLPTPPLKTDIYSPLLPPAPPPPPPAPYASDPNTPTTHPHTSPSPYIYSHHCPNCVPHSLNAPVHEVPRRSQ